MPGTGSGGNVIAGLAMFLLAMVPWWVLLGWIIHLWAAHDAATWRG